MNFFDRARVFLRLLAGGFGLLLSTHLAAVQKWELRYFYDQNESSLVITDFKFPSARRGIAAGFVSRKIHNLVIGTRELRDPIVLLTADAGKTWSQIAMKEIANAIFFLDDSVGWMVTEGGVWFTDESGRTWKKVSAQPKLTRIYFLTAVHGFAAGREALPLETNDAGKTWTRVAVSPPVAPPAKKSRYLTVYHDIAFDASGNGVIAGEVIDPDVEGEYEPDWMNPGMGAGNWHNQTNLFLVTHNGGKTWQRTVRGLYGRAYRIAAFPEVPTFCIWEFPQFFPWASNLSILDLSTDVVTQLTRERDRVFTDILQTPKGDAYLAAYQTPGHVHPSPIPGKVRISKSSDLLHWTDIPADYRAVAQRVWLASAGGAALWAATDTGMILKLEDTAKK